MASREIRDLSATVQVLHNKFADRCRRDVWMLKAGVTALLICTYRSFEEQDKLYAQGRAAPGPIVTNARAGKSAHNVKLADGTPAAEAFDVVMCRHGKPVWSTKGAGVNDDPLDDETNDLEAWQRIGAHGVAVGLKWYGSPGSPFREFPHFQNPEWRLA